MIYLNPEVRSGLGEDTFWTWFEREFNASFDIPAVLGDNDILLHYSTMGRCTIEGGTKIALCWELYPEMKLQLGSNEWDAKIDLTHEAAASCDKIVVANELSRDYYGGTILPIGIDTDTFKYRDQGKMRKKHGFSSTVELAFWCGTNHPMKGFDSLIDYAARRPEVRWIVVYKDPEASRPIANAAYYTRVSQTTLAELMNCANYAIDASRLRPYFMVEWEQMACNLPLMQITSLKREFKQEHPINQNVFNRGWDRASAKETWRKYLDINL